MLWGAAWGPTVGFLQKRGARGAVTSVANMGNTYLLDNTQRRLHGRWSQAVAHGQGQGGGGAAAPAASSLPSPGSDGGLLYALQGRRQSLVGDRWQPHTYNASAVVDGGVLSSRTSLAEDDARRGQAGSAGRLMEGGVAPCTASIVWAAGTPCATM